MSAPAMKVRPAAVSTIAWIDGSLSARSKQSFKPARTACLSALTGGLSTTMTATAPGRSSTMLDKDFPPSRADQRSLLEHDLFRKPVPTFRDHALRTTMFLHY